MKYYTYILKCFDNTYYTGWTIDLSNRVKTHNAGRGSKYTRGRLPVLLVYFETYNKKKIAMQREYQIKKMSRKQKKQLIQGFY